MIGLFKVKKEEKEIVQMENTKKITIHFISTREADFESVLKQAIKSHMELKEIHM